MSVSKSRILDLLKVRARIFNTTFNPTGIKTGNAVLRQRLKGPALANYYPRRVIGLKELVKAFPEHEGYNEDEEERLENIVILRARGKGPPKKKRTADDSKKKGKRK